MGIQARHLPLAAAALYCLSGLSVAEAAPNETPGHDPAQQDALRAMPIHAVVANERLRSQITYGYVDVGSAAINATNNLYFSTPGLAYGQAAAAGLAGGLIASALINAEAYASAKRQVADADAEFERAQCKLSNSDALFAAVERSIGATSWGADREPGRHVLARKQKLDDLVPQDAPRYEFVATYSMTPDYSALVTSMTLAAFSAQLPDAPKRWQRQPAWSDNLVVVSDIVPLNPKTSADVEAGIARETARHAATGASDLIRAANAGDREARKQANALLREHRARMKEAKRPDWTPREAAAARARMWSANGCERVHSMLARNAVEIEEMMGRLFAGTLPPRDGSGGAAVAADATAGERAVHVRPGGLYVMQSPDANVPLNWRYSWFPDGGEEDTAAQ